MQMLWFSDLLEKWDSLSWIDAWAATGEVRVLCEKHLGEEHDRWRFIDLRGNATAGLPHGILFYDAADATVIRLML